jgi:TfoX/Sxy family transcriptional regulator of competence genes
MSMAFDEQLAERVRDTLTAAGVATTEKKMFGGLSFLVGGNMCCGVLGADLLARVGPEAADSALAEPATRPFDMGRGPSKGWVVVAPDGIATEEALAAWVGRSIAFAASLPPKG